MDRGKLEELKRLHDDGVIDDEAYKKAVDSELSDKRPALTERFKVNKTIVAIVAILVGVACFLFYGATVGFKPSGISDRDYGLAKKAISVTESYLNGSTGASRAYEDLSDIDGQIDDPGIRLDVSSISHELMNEHLDLGDADDSTIRSNLTELKRSVGYMI